MTGEYVDDIGALLRTPHGMATAVALALVLMVIGELSRSHLC